MKEKILDLLKRKCLDLLKRKWWYFILVIASSIYVFYYRYEIYQLSELTAQNLVFVLWLALLILPLFSEIEIGSVKLKRELERTRSEVKESISELRLQIMDLKISNSNTFVVNNAPLASKSKIEELSQDIASSGEKNDTSDLFDNISDKNVYLFQVRLTLETLLSSICDMLDYRGRKNIYQMTNMLLKYELLNGNTVEQIQEIIKIANRGVHGEIVSDEYISFVKKVFPAVKRSLEEIEASDKLKYFTQSY